MIAKPEFSKGWRIGGLLVFGCATFAAGWWLKPVEIRPGLGGKIPVRDEPVRLTSRTGNSQNTGDAKGMEQYQSPEVRARFLPKGGGEPRTLIDRLRLTFADPGNYMQELAFSRTLSEMEASDAPGILALLDEIQAGRVNAPDAQRLAFYTQWGNIDPAAALDHIKSLGKNKSHFAIEVIEGWAARDMPAALKRLNDETDPGFRGKLLRGVVVTYAAHDLDQATKWALSHDRADAVECGDSLGWAAASSYGIEKANSWYRDLPNDGSDGLKMNAWKAMISTAQKVGGQPLIDLLQSSADLPWCKPEQIAGGLRAAQAGGTSTGLDFLAALPAGGLEKMENRLSAVFSESSLSEAGAWLKKNQASPSYDFLAGEFANSLRAINPATADEWVATIKDPNRRKHAGGH